MEDEEVVVSNKINIPRNAKVKVYWDDRPENYSRAAMNAVKSSFADKYGVSKANIQVIYKATKVDDKGNVIEIDGANLENIMDKGYQRSLMTEWVKREGIDVDFDRLMKLDDKVNGELNIDLEGRTNRRWTIKWVMINNFLCFGEDNFVSMNNLNGLVVVNSEPKNQGGKTTFSVDAMKYLLFGSTTKTDKNEEVFNQYSDKNELIVRGMVDIDGEETIIERHMTRSPKRKGGWNIKNVVKYYNILPDGSEEEQNDEHAGKTTKKIKETIGLESDFELVVLTTGRNIDDLIEQKPTESGKMLTRLIGLEVISNKEAIVRKMYNDFAKKMKSNVYDIVVLSEEVTQHEANLKQLELDQESNKNSLTLAKGNHQLKLDEKDVLAGSKVSVDVEITALNPTKLQATLDSLISEGTTVKTQIETLNGEINALSNIIFDEDRHAQVTSRINELNTNLVLGENEISNLESTIKMLEDGQICTTCNRPLDDVDNTDEISKNEVKITETIKNGTLIQNELDKLQLELISLNKTKGEYDERMQLELKRDRAEVEIGSLRNKVVATKADLKRYNDNLSAIDKNNDIDAEIQRVKTEISVFNHEIEELTTKSHNIVNSISSNDEDIIFKSKIIETILKEEEINKLYKVYIEMVGRKGITKLVLRSILPILNSELQRLLDEVCNFDIEIYMDNKNEVRYLLVKDGVEKPIKSASGLESTMASLALRVVLGKMSSLPMPRFITFDEVLGKVADENLPKIKPLFERIKDMYDTVFFITHEEIVKDWADTILTVKKTNNISKISSK